MERRREGGKIGVKIHRNLSNGRIKRWKSHRGQSLAWINEVFSVLPDTMKKREIIIIKELGRWGSGYIRGDGSNYRFIKVEFESLRWCYGRHRADRWIEVWICGKMSRIKIENWSHQELKSWEEMRSLWKSSQHENSGSRMDIWRIP